MNIEKHPQVSFIIPTLNAEKYLGMCLSAIRSQNYPQKRVEIIVADGGSKDKTLSIAKKYNAKVINNPEVLHEPGKDRASKVATGKLLFFTDSDNIIVGKSWIKDMVQPYLDHPDVKGFLPQTLPAPDSNSLDRYFGYLCTDPFTWFVYKNTISGRDFRKLYKPLVNKKAYRVYTFQKIDPPMFGLSQGVGTAKSFKREKIGHADDILAGIKLITEGGKIAYIPQAGVYHYHIDSFSNFVKKYSWRVRNNLSQEIKGMGLVNRTKYFSKWRKTKMYLFIPYGLSIIFPFIDMLSLLMKHRDLAMFWHVPASFIMSIIILKEGIQHKISYKKVGTYE